jgi:hypothetical protein
MGTPSASATLCWISVGCWVEEDHACRPLARQGQGGLPFEVEMLLPAHLDPPVGRWGAAAMAASGSPFLPDARAVLEPAVGGQRVVDGQDRGASV